jgi:Methylamine utilisation protein MauE
LSEFSVATLILAACVFGASAVAKLHSRAAYRSFRAGLRETTLMPAGLLPVTVAALPGAEAVTAAGLTAAAVLVATAGPGANPAAEAALTVACLLTATLAAGVAVVIRRGTQARCACFGAGSTRPLGGAHLLRNLVLLAVLAAGLASSPLGHGHPGPADTIVAAAAGAVAALLFIRWEDLAELFAPIPSLPPAAPGPGRQGRSR